MKNKKIQYFASAAALILGAVLLTTCTVGLGDSVDTKSPKVSITYPPVQSIIKNTFTLRGTASDDNELVGVMITVTNTESDEVFDGYQATVDRATNTWSFAANRRNEDGSFEFEDGKYQIVATAVDGANRKTVASTTYEIDNTAPVLVLNRPGTVGPVGGVKPEVYGSELKLTGSANDDHALDLVSMRVFRADGTQIGEPLTYPNVSGVGMDILLAKHYASPADADQQALTDRYAAIYDHSTGGTQNFYCLVDISDYAREYDPPADVASADNTRGNVSQAFWLYDGIYSRVFDKSGFGLAMSDLTSVLSGRYASVATAEEVKTYLAENQQDSTVWSDTAVTFSLNPENSPYYEVVGYNALATNEPITAKASNGTNMTVRVSAGRDQRPLLSDTIRVYLVPCNANGAPLSGEEDIPLLDSIAELAGNTAAIEERNDRLSKTGNDYVISVDVGTREPGSYYIVKVEGEDQAGNEITDLNGTFGFQVIASGIPPV
ncbi:MAG TPA: Ig-like domain-containing protein, partial [Treponemataceae bacterium]|nr:Ig-like domain-containing protein [Treponemataceae bacterium]